ncbi:hypothetical protein SCREM1_88 [Synechococcus phage S-CREM1]|nr:hypothetical protein SCREM1_88 [Synechococcus phage S-CREM1]
MALSQQVEESLDEAQASLRNALAYAARNERPLVNQAIADLMCHIDKLKSVDKLLDSMDEFKNEFRKNQ